MGIQNFPAALQPIIQQGFLEREFEAALSSRLGYRMCADREDFAVGIGDDNALAAVPNDRCLEASGVGLDLVPTGD